MYVLDTNAVSALMKGTAAVVERLAATAPADVAVPQPVLAEIAFGIERLPRSKRRAALQSRFDLDLRRAPTSRVDRCRQPDVRPHQGDPGTPWHAD